MDNASDEKLENSLEINVENEQRNTNSSVALLSPSAPEFIPGLSWTPSIIESTELSNPINVFDSKINLDTPTANMENSNADQNGQNGADSAINDEEDIIVVEQEEEKKENLENIHGDDWKTVSGNRPRGNGRNFNQRKQKKKNRGPRDDRNWPGEFVNLDNIRRYVVWSADVNVARMAIADGRLVLILMRGAPGSGKSTMARSLQADGVLYSTDDYFIQNDGSYLFDVTRLEDAHNWNFQKAVQAMTDPISPLIIDNTNIRLWEMSRYVKAAARHGYDIYFIEPDTEWKNNAEECFKRNAHRVPLETIERMIQCFEPVRSLQPMLESGLLRSWIPRASSVPSNDPLAPELRALLQAASVSPVDHLVPGLRLLAKASSTTTLKQPSNQPLVDSWAESSDSSSTWETMANGHGVDSSQPKEQRPNPRPYETTGISTTVDTSNTNDIKKTTDYSTRRKRPGGFDGISLSGFTSGPWQLPTDLAGGLLAAPIDASMESTNSDDCLDSTSSMREISVRDEGIQVTEKHLALAGLMHRRFSRHSVDGCEFGLDERTIKVPIDDHHLKSNTGVQCDQEHHSNVSDGDGYEKAMSTLCGCFPHAAVSDIQEMFERCDYQLEWTVNVLLDSGYELNWASGRNDSGQCCDSKNDVVESEDVEVEPEPRTSSLIDMPPNRKGYSNNETVDSEYPVYSLELSIDMAAQLQRIFGYIYPDIPPDLLGPSQLKVHIPDHLLAELHQCWLNSQSAEGTSDGDSDLCSEGPMSDESPAQVPLGELKATRSGKEDNDFLVVERQIWMDEQLARQIASEEDSSHIAETDSSQGTTSSAGLLASKIKWNKLCELFPGVDQCMLRNVFATNDFQLDSTIDLLCNTYNIIPKQTTRRAYGLPGRGYASRASQKPTKSSDDSTNFDDNDGLTYGQLRQEALVHFTERQANFKKAQEYFRRGMSTVAYYYAQRGHLHHAQFKEANDRAARKILQQRKAANPAGVLDLHGLHVTESIQALGDMLRDYDRRPGKELRIITGQGLHSTNGPKIKPAVVNYLHQHKYNFCESSPGVLVVTIK